MTTTADITAGLCSLPRAVEERCGLVNLSAPIWEISYLASLEHGVGPAIALVNRKP